MKFLDRYVEHEAAFPWQFVDCNRICHLRLRSKESIAKINVIFGDPFYFANSDTDTPLLEQKEALKVASIGNTTYYAIDIPMKTHKLRYHFDIVFSDGVNALLTSSGVIEPVTEQQLRPFFVPYVFEDNHYCAPSWSDHTIWYEIFPDRFSDEKDEDMSMFVPERTNYYRGTINGIRKHIPYLVDLDVTGIYLTPIFAGASNHRYDTTNYAQIDPMLGTECDFTALVAELHEAGLRIMLDGVYNHCAWDHPFWQDVVQKGERSPYFEWFDVSDVEGLHLRDLAFFKQVEKDVLPFECFAFAPDMPKWNTNNHLVIEYLTEQAAYWTREYSIDAWRLDVPDEVSERFHRVFRSKMRAINPNIYIVGEIWQDGGLWLSEGWFDATMNYPLYFAVRDFALIKKDSLEAFYRRLQTFYVSLPTQIQQRQLSFCSNHDLPRPLFLANNDDHAVQKAFFITAVFGGALSLYYGDELGMTGGSDPANRGAMRWDTLSLEKPWRRFMKALVQFKRHFVADAVLTSLFLHSSGVLEGTLTSDVGILRVFLTENGKNATLPISSLCVFGKAVKISNGYSIEGFAAFFEKAKDISQDL